MPRIQEVLGLQDVKKNPAPVFYDHAVKHQTFDIELYNDLREMSPILDTTLQEGNSKLKTFSDLSEDMFMNLFKYNPEIRDEKEITPSRRFNYNLLKELGQTEEFNKLRDMCKLNLLNSAIGTEVLHNKALVKINTVIEEQQKKKEEQQQNGGQIPPDIIEAINKMAEQENKIKNDSANQQGGGGGQQPDPNGQGGQGQGNGQDQGGQPQPGQGSPGDIASDIDFGGQGDTGGSGQSRLTKEAAEKLAKMQQQMAESQEMKDLNNQIQSALQQAAKEAQEDVKEMDKFVNAWGLGGDDSCTRVSFEESRQALERIRTSPELKKLTDIIGRFRAIAKNNLKHKSKERGQALKDVTIGNVPERILPSEKAMLADERTKKLFYKKFNEKQLLQYEVENKKRKGSGPMVVALDVSGSMNDGKRDTWGRAVALALLEVAQRQRRNYALLMFNNKVVAEWLIPKGELSPNDVLDIAERHYSGGTTFEKPVRRAMEIISKEKNFRKGDIVFITDGDCNMSEEAEEQLIKMKKDKNICIQTIIINVGGHCSDKGVERWSDEIRKISKLADLSEDTASDIFNTSING